MWKWKLILLLDRKKSDKSQRTYLVFTDSCLLIITEHCFTAAYDMPTKDGMLFPINRKCLLKQSTPKITQLDFHSLIHIHTAAIWEGWQLLGASCNVVVTSAHEGSRDWTTEAPEHSDEWKSHYNLNNFDIILKCWCDKCAVSINYIFYLLLWKKCFVSHFSHEFSELLINYYVTSEY